MRYDMFSSFFYLADAAAPTREQSIYQTLIMAGVVIVFFYFILYRPEQKRRKRLESLRTGLKRGDKVTAMGMRATIEEVREKTVILKQFDGSKIEMVTAAISEVDGADAPMACAVKS
jgi:preprotein translocase subunit YajC